MTTNKEFLKRVAFQLVHCSVPVGGQLLNVTKVVEPLQCVQCSVPVVNKTMTMNCLCVLKIYSH